MSYKIQAKNRSDSRFETWDGKSYRSRTMARIVLAGDRLAKKSRRKFGTVFKIVKKQPTRRKLGLF